MALFAHRYLAKITALQICVCRSLRPRVLYLSLANSDIMRPSAE